MKNHLLIVAVFIFSLVSCSSNPPSGNSPNGEDSGAGSAAPPQIPLNHFFRNATKRSVSISPDGKRLAFLAPYMNRMNVFVQEISKTKDGYHIAGEPKQLTKVTDRDIASAFWKGNRTVIFLRDNNGDENFHVHAVDALTGQAKDMTPFPKVQARLVNDLDEVSETDLLVGLNRRNPEVHDVYRLNVRTGDLKLVAKNPGKVTHWLADHKGKVRLGTANDGKFTQLYFRETESAPFKAGAKFDFRESLDPFFFTFDDKNIFAGSTLGRDLMAVVVADPRSGKEIEKVYEAPGYDVSYLSYSPRRKVLAAVSYHSWRQEHHFFDALSQERCEYLKSKLGDMEIFLNSSSKDETKHVVFTTSDRSRGSYYFFDDQTKALVKIADAAPWLNPEVLAPTKSIEYRTRDGLKIQAYLTLPLGKSPKNLPLVVNPHGGPWARDTWGFEPETQFLANRGYAVLQPNFRGSTGFGRKFWEASFKQWGKAMQDDITDGVKAMIDQGIADPKRVAIYGASYGGYATLAGLAFTPDLYACGVDYVGISSLFTFLESIPPYWKPYLEMLYEQVGDPVKDKTLLESSSPLFHVDKIKAPLLVAQGAQDPRVKKKESDQLVESLKKRGVEVPYLVKENEGHGFRNEENQFEFYEMMEAFLQKHIGR